MRKLLFILWICLFSFLGISFAQSLTPQQLRNLNEQSWAAQLVAEAKRHAKFADGLCQEIEAIGIEQRAQNITFQTYNCTSANVQNIPFIVVNSENLGNQ